MLDPKEKSAPVTTPEATFKTKHESGIVADAGAQRKRFKTLQARAALKGHMLQELGSDFVVSRWGRGGHLLDLDGAEALILRMEGGKPTCPMPTSREKCRALAAILRALLSTSCPAQCNRIANAQAQFPMSVFEATRYLDCYDPRARGMQLRNEGAYIVTHLRTVITESGDRHRVGLYALAAMEVST